jgi:cobalt/nickel transport system permease protein
MHLANGTVSNDICTITAVVSAAALAYAGFRVRATVTPAQVGKAVAGAAIVFVAQMIDVSWFGAVSVHMVGAAFLTLLAGPALALLAMASVIATQALVLHDGGITTLGANVLNMAVAGVGMAALVARFARLRFSGNAGLFAAASLSAAASVLAAVVAMTVELALSGTPVSSAFALTLSAHAPFVAWETAATAGFVLVAASVRAVKPFGASSSSN